MFQFGVKVKDKITGFEGTVTAKCSFITGCDQYLVQPPAKEGDFKEGKYFDEGRLVFVSDTEVSKDSVKSAEKGCDSFAPIK